MRLWIVLWLCSFSLSAWGWEYQVVVEGAIVYQESQTPGNIAYPPPGERAAVRTEGSGLQGRVISEAELQRNLAKPHVVIIPDQSIEPRQSVRID